MLEGVCAGVLAMVQDASQTLDRRLRLVESAIASDDWEERACVGFGQLGYNPMPCKCHSIALVYAIQGDA